MSPANEQLVVGGVPHVDLMPPEVRERRRGRGIRRLLVLALVAALVVVGVGYGLATVRATIATAELQAAQTRTTELLTQQMQYSEVTQLEAQRDRILAEREAVTATEVFWKAYLDPVLALLPEGASVAGMHTRVPAHSEPTLGVTGPLRAPRVAEMTLQIFTPAVPPVADWLRALDASPAFADAIPSTVTRVDTGGYLTSLTLNASEEALAQRFAESVGSDTGATDGSGDEEADQ